MLLSQLLDFEGALRRSAGTRGIFGMFTSPLFLLFHGLRGCQPLRTYSSGNTKAPHPDLTFACPGTWRLQWIQWIQWLQFQWIQAEPPRTHCARSSRSWCPWFPGFCLRSHGLELNIATSARTDPQISPGCQAQLRFRAWQWRLQG